MRGYSVGPPVPSGVRRLHLNEFRHAHPPSVLAAAQAVGAELAKPEVAAGLLTNYMPSPEARIGETLARYMSAALGVDVGQQCLAVAPGSDDVLRAVIDMAGSRGLEAAIIGVPSYTQFEHCARLRGLSVVKYQLGLRMTQEALEASLLYHEALLARGALVYLCSPNNPTGILWESGLIIRLAGIFPRSLFLVDEAYVEYAAAKQAVARDWAEAAFILNSRSAAPAALARPNVIVSRTLSKAFGLAGLRVGYALGQEGNADEIRAAVNSKGFRPGAAAIVEAAVAEAPYYLKVASETMVLGAITAARLSTEGWFVAFADANFFLVYVGTGSPDGRSPVSLLSEAGVQVRCRNDQPGLAGFARVTAGCEEDCVATLKAFSVLERPPDPPQRFYTDKRRIATLKALIRQVAGILHAAGVTYWAQGGTMLGAWRHEGMIPTDDDGDLAYLRPNDGEDPLAGLVGVFARAGVTLQRNRTDAYWQCGLNVPGAKISEDHVDVFSYKAVAEDGQTYYELEDPRFRAEDPGSAEAHCNTRYSEPELFPLTRGRFYEYELPMPAQSGKVLGRALGGDFMAVMRVRTGGGLAEFALVDPSPA
jgi:histidinol-phosphate aminotransferase